MDNLCHTLAGAALGEAGLKRRTRFGSATLMIASNLPDLDVLVLATSAPAVAFRRGWTHGVVAQLLLPAALAALVAVIAARWPRRPGAAEGAPRANFAGLLILSYIGVLLHVFMDFLNNYGVRLLKPLRETWFYGDALFIIDPWLWLTLGGGVWLARRQRLPRPAIAAVTAAALYIALMLGAARAARTVVIDAWTAASGAPPRAVMVGPVAVTPLRRAVIIDAGDRYVTGTFTWFPTAVQFDPQTVARRDTDPRVAIAREAPAIRAFLVWSRFPFWTLEPAAGGTRVTVGDMRFFSAAPGILRSRFAASVVVPD